MELPAVAGLEGDEAYVDASSRTLSLSHAYQWSVG